MELTDSSELPARASLAIDLNEIPTSSSSPPLDPSGPGQDDLDFCEPDSFDVVRAIHDNPDPAPGAAAGLPDEGREWVCGGCGRPEEGGRVLVCDGCERGFHLVCATTPAGSHKEYLDEWVCGECARGGVKSKLWPLGVKSKRILDINSSPPSDGDAECTDEFPQLRKHTSGDNSFSRNQFGDATMNLNLSFVGNGFGVNKGPVLKMHPLGVGFEDVLNNAQTVNRSLEIDSGYLLRNSNNTAFRNSNNPSKIFLHGLKEFISERNGILEEGWHIEFERSTSSDEVCAVYCSPDGKTFGSMSEVAWHLGLMPNCNSLNTDTRNNGSSSLQERSHFPKKRKAKRLLSANGFAGKKENLVNGYHEELLSNSESTGIGNAKVGKVIEAEVEEDGVNKLPQPSDQGLPVQFEDFFILSLGRIDTRSSYHDVSIIWPVGFKSCWHDKITGSLFTCEVSDGGDSGPIFKVRRFSCSMLPVPQGSTILYKSNLGQFASQNNQESSDVICYNQDCEDDGSIEMILADPFPPTEYDILTCLQTASSETSGGETLGCSSLHGRSGDLPSGNLRSGDKIGEISVEEHSSSSAWRLISKKLVDTYSEICKQQGNLKLFCNHVDSELGLSISNLQDEKSKASNFSLSKFCSSPSLVSIALDYEGELDTLSAALLKWLDQDRFGLDTAFVQEMIEQLPGAEACSKYELLTNRGHCSECLTIGNGLLMAKRKREAESGASFGKPKKAKVVVDNLMDDHDDDPPPGRLLCSKLPPVLVGDFYQVWELLWRFQEKLGLNEPFSETELEEELIGPWSDGSNLHENLEEKFLGSQVPDVHTLDSMNEQISSFCDEFHMVDLHKLVQVETGVMKDTSQTNLASDTINRCTGVALTKVHGSLLGVLIGELQSKVAVLVDPNFDSGEMKSRRGRRKDADSLMRVRRSLSMLPINELTWPELARRYILAFLSMNGNLDSSEIANRESGKVFRCLQGDGGVLCGSLTGVAAMEADALLLAEATRRIFGSLSREKAVLVIEEETADGDVGGEKNNVNECNIPEWAQVLEPVRKLPTNVGTRIRKCVYDALEKGPPEWAKKRLEHSISKDVYKGNASGPTKKAVLSVLADVSKEEILPKKCDKSNKKKVAISISDIVMKQCRIVLRHVAEADHEKTFCTLLGRNLINSGDNDDEGLLGSPAMVSRPLDFRTIDLRLAVGAYGGSHESFLEDVRELWNNICTAFGDQPDLVQLAETLSQKFESLYEMEVLALVEKLDGYAKLDSINAEIKKELDDVLASVNKIPKAPWDEGVCKVCGVDRDDDSVLLCDTCDAEYHTYCLNPPLPRIPDGNWYCPSCALGGQLAQVASRSTQLICQNHSKKHRGEVTGVYLEALMHLAVAMEEKDYWELSVDERTFLLKFLCDELLNSALIRHYLEQCMEKTAELQQKLRVLSAEWKSLKSKEELLALRAAKMDTNAVGEVGGNGNLASTLAKQSKSVGEAANCSNIPSHCDTFSTDLPATEVGQEGTLNSERKSDENNNCNGQVVHAKDTEDQAKDLHADMNGSNTVEMDEIQCQGNLQQNSGKDTSFLPPTDHQGYCLLSEVNSHIGNHVDVNESNAYHLELSTVKNDLHHLQNSINSIESQLFRLSVRREFLGSDSRGRLYWASAAPGGCTRVIVDGSSTMQQSAKSDHRDLLARCSSSSLNNFLNLNRLTCNPYNAVPLCLPWVSYETKKEIEELVDWLSDNDQKERELKESIMQLLKLRFQESQQSGNIVQEHQAAKSMEKNNDKTALHTDYVTKAAKLLEIRYGACIQLDSTEMLEKQGQKAMLTGIEKTYRCCCLEPIWSSRHHCLSCHRSFTSDVEFKGHSDGRCNLIAPVHEKSKEMDSSLNGRGNVKSDSTQKVCATGICNVETSKSGGSELSTSLIKFQNEGMACPFNFEETRSKFVTKDSNRELVQEIGLIGSNGVPTIITSISPYLNDSALMMIPQQKDLSMTDAKFNVDEMLALSDGNRNGIDSGIGSISDNCSRKSAGNEISKASKTDKPPLRCLDQRGRKSSLNGNFPESRAGHCCVIPRSSLRPLVGKGSHVLRQLKLSLLDMEAALPKEALRPSKAQLERRWAWRSYVKSAASIYEMVQSTIILEDMIKTEYLRNEWWYWSSISAAAKTSSVASLALRIYALDDAILYEKILPSMDQADSLKASSIPDQKSLPGLDPVDKLKVSRKSNKKRKEPEG